jgi:hypothetical protein
VRAPPPPHDRRGGPVGSTCRKIDQCRRLRVLSVAPSPVPTSPLILSLTSVRTHAQCSTRRCPSRALFLSASRHDGLPFRWSALAASFAPVYPACIFSFPFLLSSPASFPVSLLRCKCGNVKGMRGSKLLTRVLSRGIGRH